MRGEIVCTNDILRDALPDTFSTHTEFFIDYTVNILCNHLYYLMKNSPDILRVGIHSFIVVLVFDIGLSDVLCSIVFQKCLTNHYAIKNPK